jgi:hypothetical protein
MTITNSATLTWLWQTNVQAVFTQLFQQGDGGSFSDMDGTFIQDINPTTNHGSNPVLTVEGGPIQRALVRFPNFIGSQSGQVPSNAIIQSAALRIHVNSLSLASQYVHKVLSPWAENTVTWSSFNGGGTAGVDYAVTPNAVFVPAAEGTNNNLDITALVREWLAGTANQGVMILGYTGDSMQFLSDDYATVTNRPRLTVVYTIPQETRSFRQGDGGGFSDMDGTFIHDTNPGANYGSNAILYVEGSPNQRALIRFPNFVGSQTGQVPAYAAIESATLRIWVNNLSAASQTVHKVLSPWSENGITWTGFNSGGVAGLDYEAVPVDAFTPETDDCYYYLDIRSAVQDWVNGETNLGLLIRGYTGDGMQLVSDDHPTPAYRPMLSVSYSNSSILAPAAVHACAQSRCLRIGGTVRCQRIVPSANGALDHRVLMDFRRYVRVQ